MRNDEPSTTSGVVPLDYRTPPPRIVSGRDGRHPWAAFFVLTAIVAILYWSLQDWHSYAYLPIAPKEPFFRFKAPLVVQIVQSAVVGAAGAIILSVVVFVIRKWASPSSFDKTPEQEDTSS